MLPKSMIITSINQANNKLILTLKIINTKTEFITMKINKIVLIMSLFIIFINGCSSANKEVSYSSNDKSAITFAKKTVVSLSGYLDKIVTKKNIRESQGNGFKKLTTYFFPRNGIASVKSSFNNYCAGIGGSLINGLCSYNNEKKGYFFVQMGIIGYESGTPKVSLKVIEPTTASPIQMVKLARSHGYRTQSEITRSNKRKASKLARLRQEKINKKSRLLQSREEASIRTRKFVMQKGSRICSVYKKIGIAFFTEDVANGKIKIKMGQHDIWDWPKNWYLCERN